MTSYDPYVCPILRLFPDFPLEIVCEHHFYLYFLLHFKLQFLEIKMQVKDQSIIFWSVWNFEGLMCGLGHTLYLCTGVTSGGAWKTTCNAGYLTTVGCIQGMHLNPCALSPGHVFKVLDYRLLLLLRIWDFSERKTLQSVEQNFIYLKWRRMNLLYPHLMGFVL